MQSSDNIRQMNEGKNEEMMYAPKLETIANWNHIGLSEFAVSGNLEIATLHQLDVAALSSSELAAAPLNVVAKERNFKTSNSISTHLIR